MKNEEQDIKNETEIENENENKNDKIDSCDDIVKVNDALGKEVDIDMMRKKNGNDGEEKENIQEDNIEIEMISTNNMEHKIVEKQHVSEDGRVFGMQLRRNGAISSFTRKGGFIQFKVLKNKSLHEEIMLMRKLQNNFRSPFLNKRKELIDTIYFSFNDSDEEITENLKVWDTVSFKIVRSENTIGAHSIKVLN
jgi:hypothetical protein